MPVLGNKTTGTPTGSTVIDGRTGQQNHNVLTSSFHKMWGHNGHAYSMGIRAGSEYSTTCSMILATWHNSTGTDPLAGRTAAIAVTQDYDTYKPLTEANLQSAFLLLGDESYYLGVHETNGALEIGVNLSGSYALPWTRAYTTDTPPDPLAPDTYLATGGPIYVWLNYEENVAPSLPTNFDPVDGGNTTDTTPTYAADFTDDNETLPNGLASDYLQAYQIQVRSVASENAITGTVVWDSGTVVASSAERTAGRMSKDHGGAALSLGQRYQWRCRHQDRFAAWSSWSHADAVAWSDFIVAAGAVVTLDGTPTGRTTDRTPDFQFRYHHVDGNAGDRCQIRLYAGTTLLQTSSEITKALTSSAAPGTLYTITAAESGFGTLASDVNYGYAVRARVTSGSIWSDYSAIRTFKTNGAPTTPSSLTPPAGSVVTAYPLLTCVTTDPDSDTLTVSAYVRHANGTAIATRTMTQVGTTNTYQYQTVVGDHPDSYATYRWAASATDGDLTSATSGESTWVYAEGPTVSVTAPTADEVLTTDTPLITWTTTDQQKKRVRVYLAADDSLVHDSTELTSTVSSYALPENLLLNNGSYYLTVEVKNSAPLTGTSAPRYFSLIYTAPAAVLGFLASGYPGLFDTEPSMVLLTWTAVETDISAFEGYTITRRISGQDASADVVLATLSTRDQRSWVDTMPVSGVTYTYSIVQRVRESSFDVLTSVPATNDVAVNLKGSVLSDARNSLHLRAVFDSVQERDELLVQDVTEVATWDGGPPWAFEGPGRYRTIHMVANVYGTDVLVVDDVLEHFRGAADQAQPLVAPYGGLSGVRSDGSSVIVCYRDERGLKLFGRLRDPVVRYVRLRRAEVEFDFVETSYSEA